MKKDINYKIASLIYRAQKSSDAGKGIYPESEIHMDRSAIHYGYAVKVDCIRDAIRLITCSRSQFNYYVQADVPDQNGYASVITYFEFKLNGIRKQVSFHTPWSLATQLKPYFNTGRKTRWNRIPGGSYRATEELKEFYGLK